MATATLEKTAQNSAPRSESDQETDAILAQLVADEKSANDTPEPEQPAADPEPVPGETVHNVTVIKKEGPKRSYDFVAETGATLVAGKTAIDAWLVKLDANDWAGALLALDKIDGIATFRIDGVITSQATKRTKGSTARATVLLNNAYKALAAAGKIDGGYKFVAVSIKGGKDRPDGTRLFKMR